MYFLAQSALALRCENKKLSLWAGQKQHTEGPTVFTVFFFCLFSLATALFTFAMYVGPYKLKYFSLQLIDLFRCLMVLSLVKQYRQLPPNLLDSCVFGKLYSLLCGTLSPLGMHQGQICLYIHLGEGLLSFLAHSLSPPLSIVDFNSVIHSSPCCSPSYIGPLLKWWSTCAISWRRIDILQQMCFDKATFFLIVTVLSFIVLVWSPKLVTPSFFNVLDTLNFKFPDFHCSSNWAEYVFFYSVFH